MNKAKEIYERSILDIGHAYQYYGHQGPYFPCFKLVFGFFISNKSNMKSKKLKNEKLLNLLEIQIEIYWKSNFFFFYNIILYCYIV